MNNDDLFPFSTSAPRPVIFIKPRARLPEAIRVNLRAAGSQAPGETLRLLLADIDEDPHQPRTVFDAAELQSMAGFCRISQSRTKFGRILQARVGPGRTYAAIA